MLKIKCSKCKKTLDRGSNYCPNCGTKINKHSKLFSMLIFFITITLLFWGTVFTLLTKKWYMIIFWFVSLFILGNILIHNKIFYYFISTKKLNYKLLHKLYNFKLLNKKDLFLIDYIRIQKGFTSILNNEEGIKVECENHCNMKNEIQQNFINCMKDKDTNK